MLSRTCYGESTAYALQKSSVLRWLQKQDDDDDEEKLQMAAVKEFCGTNRQQSCAVHNVKVESAGSLSRHVKKNVERNKQLSPTLEHTDQSCMMVQHDEDTY